MDPQQQDQETSQDQSQPGDQGEDQDPIQRLGQILIAMQEGFKSASPEIQKAVQGVMDAYANLVSTLGGKGPGPMANTSAQEGGNPNARAVA